MSRRRNDYVLYGAIGVAALAAPFLFPAFQIQLAFLWLMILFAMTWDIMGGQMGYNSFGNILYFGVGMYVSAVVQVGLFYDVAAYTSAAGANIQSFTSSQFLWGMALGMPLAGLAAAALAVVLGTGMLGLRGHYFAIGTLGLGILAAELAGAWDYIGAGSGMVPPLFPDGLGSRSRFFYFVLFGIVVATFFTLKWLYSGRFGLAINAIRDDEDKAEAMGLHTRRYKTVAWGVSAFFLGLAGGPVGSMIGFIDPRDTAFAGTTWGVFMVLMAILGGKGTIWGPVIGAAIFHTTQELFWTFLLGWQRVAMGALIVLIVVFFPQGIMGWLRERLPERFGHRVEDSPAGPGD